MFKKLHHQMTFFCTLITSIIMIAMTVVCLYFSETGIRKNAHMSFLRDVDSMVTNLGNQSVLSYEWIAKMENSGQYIIHISNNGNPLLYDRLRESHEREDLVARAKFIAEDTYQFSLNSISSSVVTNQIDFEMETPYQEQYYTFAAVLPRSNGYLSVIIIASQSSTEQQIYYQRLAFIFIGCVAIILLSIFSYLFTKRMIQPLEESRTNQNQFIASASHELRTPLAVILSSLSAYRKADKYEGERFAQAIETEGKQMSRLIDDLLTLASVDNMSWSLNPKPLEPDTLLIDIFEKYELVAAAKKIALNITLPDEMLPRIKGDKQRLEQVLSILVDNAISYTPQSGKITLSASISGSQLFIEVSDNGSGVPDELKTQIWERFYRADKSRTGKKHFGLGLSIAKEIIRLHKGRIWVEDNPGGGAVFIIQLNTIENK